MKKHFFSFAFVAMIGFTANLIGHSKNSDSSAKALTLANIEALSEGEAGYLYVTPIEYSWGWGCNCAGRGSEECCG